MLKKFAENWYARFAPVDPAGPVALKRPQLWDSLSVLAERAMMGLVLAAAAYYVLVYIGLALIRVPYPYELEWLEGGMVHEVQRVLEGKPLYTKASLEYVPFLYTPLYFYLCAPVAAVMGVGFTPLRLVSFVASLGVFLLIYCFIRRETGNRFAGLLGVGLYAATFRIGGAWFDTARVDSLLLLFLLGAIYAVAFHTCTRGAVITGLLLSAAFLTKQSSLLVIAPMLFYLLLVNWRRALVAGGITAALLLGSTLVLNILNGGWYWYYFIEQTTKSGFVSKYWIGYWRDDLIAPYGIALAFALLAHFFCLGSLRVWRFVLFAGITCGIIAMTWASRLHVGGYNNVMMPMYAWLAMLAPIALVQLRRVLRERPQIFAAAGYSGLLALFLVQFLLLFYKPSEQAPSQEDRQTAERMLNLIACTEGDVFMPYHNFFPALAGKEVFVNKAGINGILDDRAHPQRAELLRELREAIEGQQFGLIILDNAAFFRPEIQRHYRPIRFDYPSREAFMPVTGMRTRPSVWYVPKPRK